MPLPPPTHAVSFNVSGAWPMDDTLLVADLDSAPPFPPVLRRDDGGAISGGGDMGDSRGSSNSNGSVVIGSEIIGGDDVNAIGGAGGGAGGRFGGWAAAAVEAVGRPCVIDSAEDAHSGTCDILPRDEMAVVEEEAPTHHRDETAAVTPSHGAAGAGGPRVQAGEPRVARLEASSVDEASGASVHCEANVTLQDGALIVESYALYASAWRSASRLDVCALLPCANAQLVVSSAATQTKNASLGGVMVGEGADGRRALSCASTFEGSLVTAAVSVRMTTAGGAKARVVSPLVAAGSAEVLPRSATQIAVAARGTSAALHVAAVRPLYLAAIYAVDATSPESLVGG